MGKHGPQPLKMHITGSPNKAKLKPLIFKAFIQAQRIPYKGENNSNNNTSIPKTKHSPSNKFNLKPNGSQPTFHNIPSRLKHERKKISNTT